LAPSTEYSWVGIHPLSTPSAAKVLPSLLLARRRQMGRRAKQATHRDVMTLRQRHADESRWAGIRSRRAHQEVLQTRKLVRLSNKSLPAWPSELGSISRPKSPSHQRAAPQYLPICSLLWSQSCCLAALVVCCPVRRNPAPAFVLHRRLEPGAGALQTSRKHCLSSLWHANAADAAAASPAPPLHALPMFSWHARQASDRTR
jgi:hypothetical protein